MKKFLLHDLKVAVSSTSLVSSSSSNADSVVLVVIEVFEFVELKFSVLVDLTSLQHSINAESNVTPRLNFLNAHFFPDVPLARPKKYF